MTTLRVPLLLFAVFVSLAGCQSRPVPPAGEEVPGSARALASWNLAGRLGYRAGNEGGSASLDWQQRDSAGVIRFSGPLGFGSAAIHWQPGLATLSTGRETVSAGDPTSLALQLTGLLLPVDALQYWVRGLPAPTDTAHLARDDNGDLSQLEQMGWQLELTRYQDYLGLRLPGKIRAQRDDQRFTLLIRHWEPLP